MLGSGKSSENVELQISDDDILKQLNILFKQHKYSIVEKLAKNYSSYRYLGAKGLVVMASNFYGLKDSFQATYILESVIKNFTDYKDVVAEAQTELDTIKKEEAKTNASISK